MVREICLLGNPVLRTKCETVKEFSGQGLKRTIGDLVDTLTYQRSTHSFGRGIAAPQIGVARKIIFINAEEPVVLINPEILGKSRQLMTLWDDCFSFPGILVKVKRHVKVSVGYRNEKGEKKRFDAVGGLSELLQHEMDHLNGVLAIDRAIDSKHIILKSELKKLTSGAESLYQL